MKCAQVRIALPDYVRGKLAENERKTVAGHVDSCRDCSAECDDLRSLFSSLDAAGAWKPTEQYFASLLPRIHERIDRKQRRRLSEWTTRLVLPVSAAVVAVIVLVKTLSPEIGPQPEESAGLLTQVPREELQQAEEQDMVVGMSAAGESSLLANDTEVVKELLLNENRLASYSEIDLENAVSALNDSELDRLLSLLGTTSGVNTN